jgi:hypothetical protein
MKTLAAVLMLFALPSAEAKGGDRRTVLYEDAVSVLGPGLPGASDLWLTTAELTQATQFVLKPEGVCREELCVPVPKARKDEFLKTASKTTWFNLSAFARLLKQPAAREQALGVFVFGPRPELQNAYLQSLAAPDFTLPDKDGRPHSLSEFRGRKVLLVTWASW